MPSVGLGASSFAFLESTLKTTLLASKFLVLRSPSEMQSRRLGVSSVLVFESTPYALFRDRAGASNRNPSKWNRFIHDGGFPGPRRESRAISVRPTTGHGPIFSREIIEDLQNHGLDEPLRGRGGVLQEQTSARHAIYYTDNRCYSDCGASTRCKSITKINK